MTKKTSQKAAPPADFTPRITLGLIDGPVTEIGLDADGTVITKVNGKKVEAPLHDRVEMNDVGFQFGRDA